MRVALALNLDGSNVEWRTLMLGGGWHSDVLAHIQAHNTGFSAAQTSTTTNPLLESTAAATATATAVATAAAVAIPVAADDAAVSTPAMDAQLAGALCAILFRMLVIVTGVSTITTVALLAQRG